MDFETLAAGLNCTPPAIDDFPSDLLSEDERRKGAILVHILVSLYLFVALAVVCDNYFVPAVEKICHALNMSVDVAGATFMAAATSAPELFVNVIGTFITEGDIGVGTIVGSAVFNILAVAACCGISAGMCGVKVIPLDWWPLTRDCLAYGITVSILICIIHDERIEWYEALILVLLYIIYILIMYFDKSIQKWARRGIKHLKGSKQSKIVSISQEHSVVNNSSVNESYNPKSEEINNDNNIVNDIDTNNKQSHLNGSVKGNSEQLEMKSEIKLELSSRDTEEQLPFWKWPSENGTFRQLMWIVTWPIRLVFFLTIPDCEKPKLKKWFPITFLMCIIWIGSLSYIVAWMITIIGDTLRIPDSVMGITFLAAGTSVPEAVSSVIVTRQGHGSMGISNSIGSNTFDILLCLGLPWFIKATFMPTLPGKHWVGINSAGIEYSAISLLSSLLILYGAFALNKFRLDKRVGLICLLMYGVFLLLASLIELNVFFRVNLPTCDR
ncbi:sodium/potassium/calcium exchanger 3 isoform X1 [Sitophilus oryzae]|uniref:Sodium/potassium/calcium exchanger 5 n=1 Tax=Sitophilus oryzae TaxID=7048 RepID=A0A6J2X9F1_SITOR|nr:sodium/potassium/calcium exchanger 3 isoform X1 [Sitophilus oryzae]